MDNARNMNTYQESVPRYALDGKQEVTFQIQLRMPRVHTATFQVRLYALSLAVGKGDDIAIGGICH